MEGTEFDLLTFLWATRSRPHCGTAKGEQFVERVNKAWSRQMVWLKEQRKYRELSCQIKENEERLFQLLRRPGKGLVYQLKQRIASRGGECYAEFVQLLLISLIIISLLLVLQGDSIPTGRRNSIFTVIWNSHTVHKYLCQSFMLIQW